MVKGLENIFCPLKYKQGSFQKKMNTEGSDNNFFLKVFRREKCEKQAIINLNKQAASILHACFTCSLTDLIWRMICHIKFDCQGEIRCAVA
jgi:hypothetical protein